MIITLNQDINSSLQVGDTLYYASLEENQANANSLFSNTANPKIIGEVISINGNSIEVGETAAGLNVSVNDFLFFVKDFKVNTSGLKGYYAKVRLQTNSSSASKLFSVSAEVSESSK
jgi:hypothetical protein